MSRRGEDSRVWAAGGEGIQDTRDMEGEHMESSNNHSIESSDGEEEEINGLLISSSSPPIDNQNATSPPIEPGGWGGEGGA